MHKRQEWKGTSKWGAIKEKWKEYFTKLFNECGETKSILVTLKKIGITYSISMEMHGRMGHFLVNK